MATEWKSEVDLLKKANEILAEPRYWAQGVEARNKDGKIVEPWLDGAVIFCTTGAITGAKAQFKRQGFGVLPTAEDKAISAVEYVLGVKDVPDWNDNEDRVFADVKTALLTAAGYAETLDTELYGPSRVS